MPSGIAYYLGISVLICFLSTWVFRKKNRRRSKFPLAKGYPIIGNALDIRPVNVLKTAFTNPAKYGPVYEMHVAGASGFMIGDPQLMKEIFMKMPKKVRRRSGNEYSSNVLGIQNGLFESRGAVWSHNRRVTAPAFSSQNIKFKFQTILIEVKAFMDRIRQFEGKVVDIKVEAFNLTIRVITAIAFGLQTNDSCPAVSYFFSPQFIHDTNAMFKFNGEHRLFPYPKWLWKYSSYYQYEVQAVLAVNRFTAACEQLIAYKQQLLYEDRIKAEHYSMIDSLIMANSSSSSSSSSSSNEDNELIIANMKTFFLAGSETTSVAITWSAYVLSHYPEIKAKVREEVSRVLVQQGRRRDDDDLTEYITHDTIAELTYCTAVAKEVLRCYGAVPILGLEVENLDGEVEISKDLILQAGDALWMNIEYVSHDPVAFAPDPLVFRPERWLVSSSNAEQLKKMEESFLCFGTGPRVCPGITLAVHEIILAIALLGYYFELDLACPVNEIERVVGWTAAANKMPMIAKYRSYPDHKE